MSLRDIPFVAGEYDDDLTPEMLNNGANDDLLFAKMAKRETADSCWIPMS